MESHHIPRDGDRKRIETPKLTNMYRRTYYSGATKEWTKPMFSSSSWTLKNKCDQKQLGFISALHLSSHRPSSRSTCTTPPSQVLTRRQNINKIPKICCCPKLRFRTGVSSCPKRVSEGTRRIHIGLFLKAQDRDCGLSKNPPDDPNPAGGTSIDGPHK